MPFNVRRLPPFDRQVRDICKKFPNSQKDIEKAIEALGKNPLNGDGYPGFGQFRIRKWRVALNAYNISERKGLRLIFMVIEEKFLILPLVLYKKGQIPSEQDVLKLTKSKLKEILAEL